MSVFEFVKRQVSANEGGDKNVGSAQKQTETSASQLLSTLAPVAVYALIWFILFLIFRRKFTRRYGARSFVSSLSEQERTPKLPDGMFNWFGAFFSIPDTHVLTHHTMDGYLFLRFLKMAVVSCLIGCLITFPVLFPVYATGGAGQSQLNILTFGNVKNPWRYFATAGCAWVFFAFIIFMITRETIFYINLRQAYLMSPLYAQRLSSRTVLFTSVPDDYLDEAKIRFVLGEHVRRVWIPTNTKELEELVEERDKVAMKLEGAETKLCKLANLSYHKTGPPATGLENDGGESGSIAARWVAPKERPTHRLKPLIGQKVDTIEWSRDRLQELLPKIEQERAKHRSGNAEKINSVFVEFDTLVEAQAAFQALTHHTPLHMAPRFTGLIPREVIWSNLRIKWWERVVRLFCTTGFVTALIIFWSIPVALVASLSNLNNLYKTPGFSWLSFLDKLPKPIFGVITGLLPSILLAVLMAVLPIILRFVAKLSGDPTRSQIELTTQNYYFGFQVVQVFLVASLGSGAAAAAGQIVQDPSKAATLLSDNLPKASNFYLSFIILQGLGIVSGLLLGLAGLVIAMVLSKLLDSTPRKRYNRWVKLASLGWGTVFPVYTNLFVIGIAYSTIAPLVLLFAAIGLWLFYFAYRYNLLFVYDQDVDTKGLVYPRALQHLFVGLYISQMCLIGLFAVNLGKGVQSLGPLIMMIIAIVFTAVYQLSLNDAVGPLLNYLPKSLHAEEQRLLAEERTENSFDNNGELPQEAGGPGSLEKPASPTVAKGGHSPAPHKKPNMIAKFLKPHIYCDYQTMRRLVPKDFADIRYEAEVERDAYYHPAISTPMPVLWIPKDAAGVSVVECADTTKVTKMTDEHAHFDENSKLVWDEDASAAPIHEAKVYY